ncbi:LYR motif-containing protein 2 isoform X2 [Lontra canadensis]|uniref:LYR motif-containing protein 2 isoform X2 n=1 Tax=Lontra canadensis TaxID=76717 RepID=UPI0013F302D6|nr:LYR motif-containing protein 2 isoform X2 [Lontra canadensis]
MATSRLPPATLTLKQFMRRQQVLLLYRRILQAIREVPNDSDRKYLKDWAREEFKRNKSATEENRSKKVIPESDQHLKNLGEILQNGAQRGMRRRRRLSTEQCNRSPYRRTTQP